MSTDQSTTRSTESESRAEEVVARDLDEIKRMGQESLGDLRELGGQIRQRVEDEIKNRPMVALGAAFGAGVLVSSLVSSRIMRLAILAAGGYAVREMFGERLMEVLGPHDGESRRGEPRERGEQREHSEKGGSSR